jgi:hypothetical protein
MNSLKREALSNSSARSVTQSRATKSANIHGNMRNAANKASKGGRSRLCIHFALLPTRHAAFHQNRRKNMSAHKAHGLSLFDCNANAKASIDFIEKTRLRKQREGGNLDRTLLNPHSPLAIPVAPAAEHWPR